MLGTCPSKVIFLIFFKYIKAHQLMSQAYVSWPWAHLLYKPSSPLLGSKSACLLFKLVKLLIVSFFDFIYSRVPTGVGSDRLHWCLKGSVMLDTRSFYQEIQGAPNPIFPWKGISKVMVPKWVAFFLATATLCWTLTLDSLMRRGLPLVNRCMCHCTGESMDHLLHFDVAHALWVNMFQIFGDQ